jgi:hypothetical protein
MEECKGCEYSARMGGGLEEETYSTDWFNSDDPAAKAEAIRKFIREWFTTKDGKKPKPCTGDCEEKIRVCLPYVMTIGFPDGKGSNWFKKVSTEVGDEVYEAYLLRLDWGRWDVKVSTKCRCMEREYY